MTFRKFASVCSLGSASYGDGELRRIASSQTPNVSPNTTSYYVDGARKLDIRGMLEKSADKYNISANPSDYIFEAIRANSVNIPNENHDSFHKDELLRFDTRLGIPVYLTYVGKPHHMNHDARDPKRSRGVILDSHYNDVATAMPECPVCNVGTAETTRRDPTGIHCLSCGSPVKDEFVEILVAVDTEKDPALARGIRAGILNAGSMGCVCSSTTCNVCAHVAHNVHDFCEHIRGASKGSLWQRKGSRFEKVDVEEAKKLIKEAGLRQLQDSNSLIPVSLVSKAHDFEIRKAFEFCHGVEFDEYSRVHKPADPKARTTEILKAASEEKFSSLSLAEETEQLIRRAQQELLMPKAASKDASTFYAVRVNGSNDEIYVGSTLKLAVSNAELGKRDIAEYVKLTAWSERNALTKAIQASIEKTAQYLPMKGDVTVTVPENMNVQLAPPGQQPQQTIGPDGKPLPLPLGQQTTPGQAPQPQSIEDMTQQEMQPKDEDVSPEEFGMLPPGASGGEGLAAYAEGDNQDDEDVEKDAEAENDATSDDDTEDNDMKQKYAEVYNDFSVEVFEDHAALQAPSGEVFSVKSAHSLLTDEDKQAFGGQLIRDVIANGLVRTALKHKAAFNSRIADSNEGEPFMDLAEKPAELSGGSLENAGGDTDPDERSQMESIGGDVTVGATGKEQMSDMQEQYDKLPDDSLGEQNDDRADDGSEIIKATDSSTDNEESDMREKHPDFKMTDTSLDGYTDDTGGKTAAKKVADVALERQRKLYASRMEKMKVDFAVEKDALEQTLAARYERALRIAAKRAALNIEESPLKAKVLDSLTVGRPVGRVASTGASLDYPGMDEHLALHLIEAAWSESAHEDTEALLARTAELLHYDDKYLVSAESDLARQAARIPSVSSTDEIEMMDDVHHRAASTRAALSQGNLILAPAMADSDADSRVSRIRDALGTTTKIGRISNGEFRPN